MALQIQQAIDRLKALASALKSAVEENLEIAALDTFALVENRIVETGKDSTGNSFSPYTPQYAKKKKAAGKDVGHVNFKFTGDMLSSIGLKEKRTEGKKHVIVIGGRDNITELKLEGNAKSRPGFLNPSKEENTVVSASFKERMVEDINNILE